jgi:hypothetical protein
MLESFSGVWRKRPCGDGDNGFEFWVLGFGFCVRKSRPDHAKLKTQNAKLKT